ncbi:MAG: hypothetical protein NTV49_01050 [Kiritimatiellaeota bacterium]|nr:hypothetical protein [Kiritimatiellota bacterium]
MQTTGNGSPFTAHQPPVQRKDPSPLAHTLVVLVFVGLLIALTTLSAMNSNAAKSKAHSNPRQMPMIHMDR